MFIQWMLVQMVLKGFDAGCFGRLIIATIDLCVEDIDLKDINNKRV
jgi:hypothetical protein